MFAALFLRSVVFTDILVSQPPWAAWGSEDSSLIVLLVSENLASPALHSLQTMQLNFLSTYYLFFPRSATKTAFLQL